MFEFQDIEFKIEKPTWAQRLGRFFFWRKRMNELEVKIAIIHSLVVKSENLARRTNEYAVQALARVTESTKTLEHLKTVTESRIDSMASFVHKEREERLKGNDNATSTFSLIAQDLEKIRAVINDELDFKRMLRTDMQAMGEWSEEAQEQISGLFARTNALTEKAESSIDRHDRQAKMLKECKDRLDTMGGTFQYMEAKINGLKRPATKSKPASRKRS